MRYHVDACAQAIALEVLTDLSEGNMNLNDAIYRLDGAATVSWHMPYGSAAALVLAVLQDFLIHLESPDPDTKQAIVKLRDRLLELVSKSVVPKDMDPAAVSFEEALANQNDFWAGVE